MRILIRDGQEIIDSRSFGSVPLTIGSAPECQIKLSDHRVQASEATLAPAKDGTWVLQMHGNGTPVTLNGRPVTGSAPVGHADEIGIYDYVIAVYRSDDEVAQPAPARATVLDEEAAQLRAHPLRPGAVIKMPKEPVTLAGDRVARLAELGRAVHACPDIPRLIDLAIDTLLNDFAGRLAYVGARRNNYGAFEFEQGRNIEGKTVAAPADFANYRYRCLETRQHICIPAQSASESPSLMAVSLSCTRGELGILCVERKVGAPSYDTDDLDRLILCASAFAVRLEHIVIGHIEVQESLQSGQRTFVREIQTRMDPTTVPRWEGLQMAVYCKPGAERGGDVFDVMQLPNGLSAVLVAAVSGEGTRAALAMVETRSAFRVAGLHADPPHVFLRAMNWMLCEDRTPCRMDAAVIIMNPATGTLEFSTAGAIGAVIVNTRGDSRELTDRAAPTVGSVPGHPFGPKADRLDLGETLALYTKGCYTLRNAAGEQLGEERFIESICDGFGQAAGTAMDDLVQDHAAFFKDGRQEDDVSILLLHRVDAPV